MSNLLIVEDDPAINALLLRNMRLVGHCCVSVLNGEEALRALTSGAFDLMLLDVMLPGADGFSVLEEAGDVPVILITARGAVSDKVRGLNMGAYDYIVKPFEMAELLARVQSVLRRTKKTEPDYSSDGLIIRFGARTVLLDGEPIELTPQEFALLETLVLNRNIALSRERLLSMAWVMDFLGDSRTVDAHIVKLRKKLRLENRIQIVFKIGYRFEG